jgi:hypothetical protein
LAAIILSHDVIGSAADLAEELCIESAVLVQEMNRIDSILRLAYDLECICLVADLDGV